MKRTKIARSFSFKPHHLFRLHFIFTLLLSFYNTAGAAEIFDTIVTKVIDGDTIQISDGRVIRYLGIDAPELRKKVDNLWVYSPEPFAEEAARFNKKLVEGKKVRIELDPNIKQNDRANPLLAYVFIFEGKQLANEELLRAGLAKTETPHLLMKHRIRFWSMEELAWVEKRGLWIEKDTSP